MAKATKRFRPKIYPQNVGWAALFSWIRPVVIGAPPE
jgi:hypothetical protein